MKLYIDADTEEAITSPGVPQSLGQITFRRGDVVRVDVQFAQAGQVIELDDGTTGTLELKEKGKYDEAPVTGAVSWNKISSGTNTQYQFRFTLITEALDALFNINANPDDDLSSVELMGEVMWTDGDSSHRTQTLKVFVTNNVIRIGDAIPGGGAPPDYVIDTSDPMNPLILIDEDSTTPVEVG